MKAKNRAVLKRFFLKDHPYSNVIFKGVFTNSQLLLRDSLLEDEAVDGKKPVGTIPLKAFSYEPAVDHSFDLTLERAREIADFFEHVKKYTLQYRGGTFKLVCPKENHWYSGCNLGSEISFTVNVDYFVNALNYVRDRESELISLETGEDTLVIRGRTSGVFIAIAFKRTHVWEESGIKFSSYGGEELD